MDASSEQTDRTPFQKADKVAEGVVDLRCFSRPRHRRPSLDGRIFQEVRTARKPLDLRQRQEPREFRPLQSPISLPRDIPQDIPQEDPVTLLQQQEQALEAFAANQQQQQQQKARGIEEAFAASSTEQLGQLLDGELPRHNWDEKLDFFQDFQARKAALKLEEELEENPVLAPEAPAPIAEEKELSFELPKLPSFSLSSLLGLCNYRHLAIARFAVVACLIPATIFSFAFAQGQLEEQGRVLGMGTQALQDLKSAAASVYASDFSQTDQDFDEASMNFSKARETVDNIGLGLGEVISKLPIETPVSTAQNLTSGGENVSLAGKEISTMLEKVSRQMSSGSNGQMPLSVLTGLESNLQRAAMYLENANNSLQRVDTKYIPAEMQSKFELAQTALPLVTRNFKRLSEDYPYFMKMLGADRPQKYLLLFENSSEMRATGGFIGSYGVLDLEGGVMKNLTIDGIYNPDGQLREAIIPPMPIQKISANWSMHDSNWFADFPTSAQKTALFYEKTGGATVDGVIAITPAVIERLLEITGPIEMPAYGVTITRENFLTTTQNQVENLYDRQENRPKKILADLQPLLLAKLFSDQSLNQEAKAQRLLAVISKIEGSLQSKDILIYHRDAEIESVMQKRGWGGEIVQNQQGDYLNVINTNINGYKTDAMIAESIDLKTEISADGTIIDTVTITRKHQGGNDKYDWYNRVNADYMRVYVPQGSILLGASGHTLEEYVPPVDYKNFQADPDVAQSESTTRIDPESKTKIFEESGKTVFGNWVYVSPQEAVTVTYRYQLPFKADFSAFTKTADSYSVVVQKQAGALGSDFTASIKLPEPWKLAWQTDNFTAPNTLSQKLKQDLIYAQIFTRAQ